MMITLEKLIAQTETNRDDAIEWMHDNLCFDQRVVDRYDETIDALKNAAMNREG